MNSDKPLWIKVTDDGFTITLNSEVRNVSWKEIQAINAYKDDLITYDVICLDFVLIDSVIKITEEIEGWSDLTEKVNNIFPVIDKEWYNNIMLPAFETNFTTLFKK